LHRDTRKRGTLTVLACSMVPRNLSCGLLNAARPKVARNIEEGEAPTFLCLKIRFLSVRRLPNDRVPGRGVRAASFALSGGFSRCCQAATAGSLKIGSSLNGGMVSRVM